MRITGQLGLFLVVGLAACQPEDMAGIGGVSDFVAAGDPVRGLTSQQRMAFGRGRQVFTRVFTPETGLGPLFNADACGECHENPVAGGRGDEIEVHATAYRAGDLCDPLTNEGGPVIQQHATPLLEAALGITQEPIPPSETGVGMRTTPVLFGRGLLDRVPDAVLLAYADPDDQNHDGISGRPNRSTDGRIGRFGRKAFVPTLAEFNANAFVAEQGITNPAQLDEETIGGAPIPPGVDPVADPEITQEAVNLTDVFVRFLAPPSPAKLGQAGRGGRELFSEIGCATCHVPTLRTGASPMPALNNREFAAFTDLLLHDMGPDLADICLGLATPSEFRTEPLIALRFATQFLHDGRATTLAQAIEAHGGEAAGVRARFEGLSQAQRDALIAFLKSL